MWLTQLITKWRVGYQREVADAQNAISSKAVETFSSFEAVKIFSTERREIYQYDQLRRELQEASIKTKWLICTLHFGQNVVMGIGLVVGMILTVQDGTSVPLVNILQVPVLPGWELHPKCANKLS